MVRPKIMRERVAINILFDSQDIREFEELVGKGNLSLEIRDMVKKKLETLKKQEGPQNKEINPIGLPNYNTSTLDNYLTIDKLCENFHQQSIESIDKEKDTWMIQDSKEILEQVINRLEKRRNMLFKQGIYLVKGQIVNKCR